RTEPELAPALDASLPGSARARWPAVVLVLLYLVAVALLVVSHVREFADETDNLLGGVLLARGARLYVDFFSSHMPFAYYLAALPAAFGAVRLEEFRPFTNGLLLVATLGFVPAFGRRAGLAGMGVWAVLRVHAHPLQFREWPT